MVVGVREGFLVELRQFVSSPRRVFVRKVEDGCGNGDLDKVAPISPTG
jgi:hypothetical protein